MEVYYSFNNENTRGERKMNLKEEKKATRQSYGEALQDLGEENKKIVVLVQQRIKKNCIFAHQI